MARVLIVDDQPAFRRQLRQLLTLAGLTVVGEAGDISSAEELVKTERPDMAIVDIMLPGINGLDGVPRLKAHWPPLRVYLVSAYRDQASIYQSSAREIGAEGFTTKENIDTETVLAWSQDGEKRIPNGRDTHSGLWPGKKERHHVD